MWFEEDKAKYLIRALKYAIVTCVAIFAIYVGIVQRVISDMLVHVYSYMNQLQGVSFGVMFLLIGGMVLLFLFSVTVTARRILRLNIVEELKVKS